MKYNQNQSNNLIKITHDGRVTIPKQLLDQFQLKGDDFVLVQANGTHIQIIPVKISPKFEESRT